MLNATFSVNFKHCTVFLQKATFSGIQSWTLCLIFPQVFWMMIDFPCWKGIVFWLAWLLEASSGEVLEALLLARPGRVVRSVHAILDWPSSRVSNLCFRERMAPGGSFHSSGWPTPMEPTPVHTLLLACMIRLGQQRHEGNPSSFSATWDRDDNEFLTSTYTRMTSDTYSDPT